MMILNFTISQSLSQCARPLPLDVRVPHDREGYHCRREKQRLYFGACGVPNVGTVALNERIIKPTLHMYTLCT